MDTILPGDLPALWRARAETLSTYGDPNSARLWNIAATELERAMESSAAETLTVADAARISSYSAAYIGALIKKGTITNAGRTHAPRVRREDLPPKKQPGGRGRPSRLIELQHMATGRDVIVVPALISKGSISTEKIPADLQGLPIVYSGNSLLPHPEMARWVAARVESATVADR
jgi:sirohydrochlorin ferrochelatase